MIWRSSSWQVKFQNYSRQCCHRKSDSSRYSKPTKKGQSTSFTKKLKEPQDCVTSTNISKSSTKKKRGSRKWSTLPRISRASKPTSSVWKAPSYLNSCWSSLSSWSCATRKRELTAQVKRRFRLSSAWLKWWSSTPITTLTFRTTKSPSKANSTT